MTTDREQAIAELVEAQRNWNLYPNNASRIKIMKAARELADIEDPPLPDEVEVLMTRRPLLRSKAWPCGWGYAYALDREDEMEGEEEVYRVRITPLERLR